MLLYLQIESAQHEQHKSLADGLRANQEMKYLVTGGAGFIGSHIVRSLIDLGDEVNVIDNFITGSEQNLNEVNDAITFYQADISDREIVNQALKDVEVIFHQAALPSVPRSIKDPITSLQNNIMGTANLLDAAVKNGVRRVVYAASSSAYGNIVSQLKAEHMIPKPLSPYAVSKLTGEYLLQAFSHSYGLETVGIRYFNVFGERQDPSSQYSGVIAKFCRQMLAGERPVIFGDGTVSRDFTYISNVVEGNMLAAQTPVDNAKGEIFNIACGNSISLNELVAELNKILNLSIDPIYEAPRKGDIAHSCADIHKAQNLLGYNPVTSFNDGLKTTVEWYANQNTYVD